MVLLLQSSGFEEIVFQTLICTSGSLCVVMSREHYNRARKIQEVLSEASERILYKRFLHEKHPEISNELIDLASGEIDMTILSLCNVDHRDWSSMIINKVSRMGTLIKPFSFGWYLCTWCIIKSNVHPGFKTT